MKVRAGLSEPVINKLYGFWCRIRTTGISVEFDDFDDFCQWAAEAGYSDGMRIGRVNANGPWSPDNVVWITKQCEVETDEARAERWDAFVKPIRVQFAEELQKIETIRRQQEKREFFRYEHPDLVREGIVFCGTEKEE